MCWKCGKKYWGLLILVLGVIMLLRDLGKITLPNISDWTVIFLIVGLAVFTSSMCKCECTTDKKKR